MSTHLWALLASVPSAGFMLVVAMRRAGPGVDRNGCRVFSGISTFPVMASIPPCHRRKNAQTWTPSPDWHSVKSSQSSSNQLWKTCISYFRRWMSCAVRVRRQDSGQCRPCDCAPGRGRGKAGKAQQGQDQAIGLAGQSAMTDRIGHRPSAMADPIGHD